MKSEGIHPCVNGHGVTLSYAFVGRGMPCVEMVNRKER